MMQRKIGGAAICIHKWQPECCPHKNCGAALLRAETTAPGAPADVVAFLCPSNHMTHVYEWALGRTLADYEAAPAWRGEAVNDGDI